MVTDENFKALMDVLKGIEERLDILIKLQKMNMPAQKVGEEENKILQLCDRKHTVEDMVKETGKTEDNVKVVLTRLREKALIRTTKAKDGKAVYERI